MSPDECHVRALGSELSAVESVPIGRLLPADSPRRWGEDDEHVRLLAQSDAPLPPIIVHRPSMRVIDGMHRLLAARRHGAREIRVRFFDGPPEDAFVLAVKANVRHGLPLSAAERTAAATRIIRSHPDWSDRAIASVTSLSAKTVGAQRLRIFGSPGRSARVGKDGRVRPLTAAEGRRIAARLIAEEPSASLRSIAKRAGIAPGTVRDVRERLERGEDPVPSRPAAATAGPTAVVPRPPHAVAPSHPAFGPDTARMSAETREAMFRSLCRDPSLRMTETGRLLLRMMEIHMAADHRHIAAAVPAHCADSLSAMATACAEVWQELAVLIKASAHAPALPTAPRRSTASAV
ncbi:ParB N-terminal domain-containing protein [Streptomyces sp. DSM 3412]|uniref:ParB N-terminal domain-containing protein n=1 Tax=Streptomyces gottesmaniae TaxID=3075518 RepID=A0ABU2Z4H8_9ACTN|nr:ParB N-terminal domain-containing protein [Streptomyces sp. DSM 3412]MDT0571498.1 ParB N-terminal domain-containing protein [Streptomyces sp. DSM 3412]